MATINDKISTVKPDSTHNPVVATVSSNRTIGASSLSCTALDYWPDVAYFITYKKKSDGSKDNSTVSSWKALRSGNTLSSMTLLAGTDAGHDTTYYVEAAPTAGWAEDVIKGLQTSLNADGSLKVNTVDTAQIKAGAVTTNTLADSAVTAAKIADSTVTASKLVGVTLKGVGAPMSGTPPSAGSGQFYIQASTGSANFPAGQYAATVNFPTPFPNGLLALTWSYAKGSANFEAARTTSESATGFQLNSSNAGAAHTISYVAIGW